MKKKEVTQELSLTEACILRSKNIVIGKAAKITNKQLQFLCSRVPPSLSSYSVLGEIDKELNVRIEGYRLDIAKYLRTILKLNDKDIKIPELQAMSAAKFHFSSNDLKQGYVFLYEDYNSNHIKGVLVLNQNDTNLSVGKIYDFNEVKKELMSLRDDTAKNTVSYIRALKKIKENE